MQTVRAAARGSQVGMILVLLMVLAALLVFRSELATSRQLTAAVACATAALSIVLLTRLDRHRPFSLGLVYLSLLAIFHVGLLIPVAFNVPVTLFNSVDASWVQSPSFASAAIYVAIGIVAFALGYLFRFRSSPARSTESKGSAEQASITPDGAGVVGVILLVLGLGLWLQIALSSGIGVLGASYASFLAATAGSNTPAAYLLMGFGLSVVASSPRRSTRRFALITFGLWSVPAFALGLRGEVILPLAAYLVVANRRRLLRFRPWMALAGLGALSLGSAIRVLRQLGVGNSSVELTAFNPFQGVIELGYSIRPLVYVSSHHDATGNSFVGIATYLAPFRRFIEGRLLGRDVLSVEQDPAVFGGFIAEQVGPIGGSPMAEAYRAGGVLGLIIVLFLIGVLAATLDSVHPGKYADAVVGMLGFALLMWVRNDFTPVPAQFLLTIPVVGLMWFANQQRPQHARGARPRQHLAK